MICEYIICVLWLGTTDTEFVHGFSPPRPPLQGVAVIKLNLDGVLSNLEEIFSASSANSGRPVFVEADTDAVGEGLVGDAGVEDIMPE